MDAPLCRICGWPHWNRQPHDWRKREVEQPVARRVHTPEVAGSSPALATPQPVAKKVQVVGGGVAKHGVETGPKVRTALKTNKVQKTQQVAQFPLPPKVWKKAAKKAARREKQRERMAQKRAAG